MSRPILFLKKHQNALKNQWKQYMRRRPHRSLIRTRRRDYQRSLAIPGYISLTWEVGRILWQHKRLFMLLSLFYIILSIAFIGLGSEQAFTSLRELLNEAGGEIFDGNFGRLSQAALLLTTTLATGLNLEINDVQRVYSFILIFLIWLTSVWVLRAVLAGKKPRLRDALYNAGAPIIPTFLVALVALLQLLPLTIAVVGVQALFETQVELVGIVGVLVFTTAGLLGVLSLYLLAGSLFALVIVTLPGMYPLDALKSAGDIVIGRRLKLLFRIIWLLITIMVGWLITALPVILLDAWLKGLFSQISWVPTVPLLLVLLTSLTIIWSSCYIYILYRKVVDDQSAPA